MSGVGEVIAIVSCVAGLIEALDAGSRIVKQIKQRRAAHRAAGALPPSEELEKNLEDGKESIKKLVEKGNKRFGSDFEQGDETAQIAIMRVTIQIQNVLLNRLTQARADDGVVDFAECIDLSDQGCGDAIIALQQLYQRKLERSMPKKQETIIEEEVVLEKPAAVQRVKTAPPSSLPTQRSPDLRQRNRKVSASEEEPPTPPPTERKGSRGLLGRLHSKNSDDQKKKYKSPPTFNRALTTPADIAKPLKRSSTTNFEKPQLTKRDSRVSVSSQGSSNPDQFQSNGRGTEPHTWAEGMSRASTLGSLASMEPMTQTSSIEIAKYGGCCKYAFFIRESGPKGNLEARNTGMYVDNWILQCRSTKCRFGKQACSAKTRDYIDETIFRSHGIEYRWIFLAKSHCAQDIEASDWPYVCLICQLLNHSPQKYKGHQDLFAHIATHQEQSIAGVVLEGPLTFSNRGIKVDDQFDLNLPERESPPQAQVPPSAQETNHVEQLQKKLEDVEIDRNSKTSSLVSAQTEVSSSSAHTDPYANPWL